MKVGDLVTVAPHNDAFYLLVSMKTHDAGYLLPQCVLLLTPYGGTVAMNKEFIEVVSESR